MWRWIKNYYSKYRLLTKEHRFFLSAVAGIIFVSQIPFLINAFRTPSGMCYTGMPAIHSSDFYIYLSWFRQAMTGKWLLQNNFTPEVSVPYFNLFFVGVGKLMAWLPFPLIISYHLIKLFLSLLLYGLLYNFYIFVFADKRMALAAFILSTTMGGFFLPGPWLTEYSLFLEVYQNALHVFAVILILIFFFLQLARPRYFLVYMGLVANVLALSHSYDLVIIYGIWVFYFFLSCLVERRLLRTELLNIFIVMALNLPAVVYTAWIFFASPVLRNGVTLNASAYSLPQYVFIYGLLALFAGVGVLALGQAVWRQHRFMLSWLAAYLVIVYFPLPFALSFSFRLVLGWQIPMAYFTVHALKWIYVKYLYAFSHVYVMVLVVSLLGCGVAGNVGLLLQDIHAAAVYHAVPYYYPRSYATVAEWLTQKATDRDLLFSSFNTSYLLGGLSAKRVYWGNNFLTYKLAEKDGQVRNFLAQATGQPFLKSNGVTYLVLGPWETTWDKPGLLVDGRVVFSCDNAKVLRFQYKR